MSTTGKSRKSRIKTINEGLILEAALDVFSRYGFRGTTVDQIAARAEMSKPNLLYYFKSKEDIYEAVLEKTLAEWLAPLTDLDAEGEPLDEIRKYIAAKIALSERNPKASRLFANEILQGAPSVASVLSGPLRKIVDRKAKTIRAWIAQGRLARVDPYHLIFMIWAVTQHYADFEAQIRAVLGEGATGRKHFDIAEQTVTTVLIEGLRPR
ncbi:MAG: TetR family transcriptional regulator C-terminal domain-containing protein [Hyphomicrobiaceae bacterium]